MAELSVGWEHDESGQAHAAARWNPVLAVLSGLAAGAFYSLPFLTVAPNRLVSGEPLFLWALMQAPVGAAWLPAAAVVSLWLMAFFKPGRTLSGFAVALALALMVGLVGLAGAQASIVAQTASAFARTSLGSGFWLVGLLAGLIAADGLQRLGARRMAQSAAAAAVLIPVCLMLAAGWCDELSLVKEYANRADVFLGTVIRHLQIVVLSVWLTLCIGLPLGWAACKNARLGRWLFPLLNIIQTIPSIALFGLLMAPLAVLALAWPALGRAGISGVGLAPAVIALTLYGLLPVVRATVAGLQQVSSGVVEAATGMGMTPGQIFWRVEAVLALPVVLGGARTATIQAVGLAAVTALIGAGGLGSIMFEGLFSAAQDLVLLGVLPIIALGVLADLGFKALIALVGLSQTANGVPP